MENLNFKAIIDAIVAFLKSILTKEFPAIGGLFGDSGNDAGTEGNA